MSCFLALTCKEKVRTLSICGRQWPKVYDLCHTFLYVARVKTHTDMRESHANACDSRMSVCVLKRVRFSHVRVCFDSPNVQKRATKSDTSGHCLMFGSLSFVLMHAIELYLSFSMLNGYFMINL